MMTDRNNQSTLWLTPRQHPVASGPHSPSGRGCTRRSCWGRCATARCRAMPTPPRWAAPPAGSSSTPRRTSSTSTPPIRATLQSAVSTSAAVHPAGGCAGHAKAALSAAATGTAGLPIAGLDTDKEARKIRGPESSRRLISCTRAMLESTPHPPRPHPSPPHFYPSPNSNPPPPFLPVLPDIYKWVTHEKGILGSSGEYNRRHRKLVGPPFRSAALLSRFADVVVNRWALWCWMGCCSAWPCTAGAAQKRGHPEPGAPMWLLGMCCAGRGSCHAVPGGHSVQRLQLWKAQRRGQHCLLCPGVGASQRVA